VRSDLDLRISRGTRVVTLGTNRFARNLVLLAGRTMLRALGLTNRNVRELLHTYYQFDAPFVVDDRAFRAAFRGVTTGWDEIIATTLDCYRTAQGRG
jgi:hypothetical protein